MWSASWSRLLFTPLLIPSAFCTILVSSARFSLPSLSRRAISCAAPGKFNAVGGRGRGCHKNKEDVGFA